MNKKFYNKISVKERTPSNKDPVICETYEQTLVIGEWNSKNNMWYIPSPFNYHDFDYWGNDIIEYWYEEIDSNGNIIF